MNTDGNTSVGKAARLAAPIAAIAIALAMALGALGMGLAPERAFAQGMGDLGAAQTDGVMTQASFYTLGRTVSGTVAAGQTRSYTFSLKSGTDINYSLTAGDYAMLTLKRSGGSTILDVNDEESSGKQYLSAGSYTVTVTGNASYWYYSTANRNYRFKLSAASQSLALSAKSGKFKTIGDSREVPFIYSGTSSYLSSNLSMKVKNPKVASASYSVGSDGIGTLTITPKRLGKTTVKLSLRGAKTATYTVYVTNQTAFVAVGGKAKLTKPLGVSKAKFKSKSASKVRVNKKTGVVQGKSGGKAKVIATKGKGKKKVTFTYKVIVTDYLKLARKTYDYIEDYVPNSDKLKINYAYRGYSKTLMSGVKKLPVVYIDYSYGNSYGTWNRARVIAYYDDTYEPTFSFVSNADDIKKKKSMSKRAIKD